MFRSTSNRKSNIFDIIQIFEIMGYLSNGV